MLVTQQNDLFGLPIIEAKPSILAWENCPCAGCGICDSEGCFSKHDKYEIMITKCDDEIELLICSWQISGFPDIVFERLFKSIAAAKSHAEKWAVCEPPSKKL